MAPEAKDIDSSVLSPKPSVEKCDCASKHSPTDGVSALEKKAVVACLHKTLSQWDGKESEDVESIILSCLTDYGPGLELSTFVTDYLHKGWTGPTCTRFCSSLDKHSFGMDKCKNNTYTAWWAPGSCTVDVGPVGAAVRMMLESWIEELLQQLRTRGQLDLLTNEVAVAAAQLSCANNLSTRDEVSRLQKIIPMLVEAGCDVNAKAGGFTALSWVASAVTKEEGVQGKGELATAAEMDELLAPVVTMLREYGARFDIGGDYVAAWYSTSFKYRGWKPPTEVVNPPHPDATPLDIFAARKWSACVKACLTAKPKKPVCGVCEPKDSLELG